MGRGKGEGKGKANSSSTVSARLITDDEIRNRLGGSLSDMASGDWVQHHAQEHQQIQRCAASCTSYMIAYLGWERKSLLKTNFIE